MRNFLHRYFASIARFSGVLCAAFALEANAASESTDGSTLAQRARQILSDKCFQCHGPDAAMREADLRLDRREDAIADRGAYAAIVAGDARASQLIVRVTSDDESLVMPPIESKKQLTVADRNILRQWIDEGAVYERHWAFSPPQRPVLPTLSQEGRQWARNPIDYFAWTARESAGLVHSPEADPITLLRRLSLDLLGLPPTLEEIDQFVSAAGSGVLSDDLYSQTVERLLASRHYGEKWGKHWLDAARYADSDGYEKDLQRTMWFYRDWVVDAFNRDKPYDQFIIEQIAGDLLPSADESQLIATGFLRNSMVNEEGGADPEQFRVEGLFDRMDAIGKAILGITTQCAQCHNHKFDPLTQREYYQMLAFLNNCEEASLVALTPTQKEARDAAQREIDAIEANLQTETSDWRRRIAEWAATVRNNQPHWTIFEPTERPFEGQKFRPLENGAILSESYAPPGCDIRFSGDVRLERITGIRLELSTHPQLPGGGPGRSILGAGALSEFEAYVAPLEGAQPERKVEWSRATADVNPPSQLLKAPFFKSDASPPDARVTGPIQYAVDGDAKTAWTTDSGPATRHQARKAVFEAAQPIECSGGVRLSLELHQGHGGPNGNLRHTNIFGCFRFSVTDEVDPEADLLPQNIRDLIERADPERWSAAEWSQVFSYWRTTVPQWQTANAQIASLEASFPEGEIELIVREKAQPRATHRLERGDFLQPAEQVEPGTPEFLHKFGDSQPRNRLGFARWLASRDSPTTARALVNRVWQTYFGHGFVTTPEDLGSQSPPPSHPELLDWLSVELIESGWSLKHLHRLIVSSAVYRQSSILSQELAEHDPRNRWLARAPRLRVDGEAVRDIALCASGLLDRQIGGRSIFPPAPEFLFVPPASYGQKNWLTETDSQRFRRSLYVHAYRTVPYPPLQAFDAPRGDSACVRRDRSNTPLQALVVLNEPQFLACSHGLAQRVQGVESKRGTTRPSDAARIEQAFRLCLTRRPHADEVRILQQLLDRNRRRFASDASAATALLAAAGDEDATQSVNQTVNQTVNKQTDETAFVGDERAEASERAERAAWTVMCRALLNLDETIARQ